MSATPTTTFTERQAVIVAPHADDETLGAGGLIVRLLHAGWRVRVVIVSEGVVTARGDRQVNSEHAHAACRILGVEPPRFLGLPDQQFDTVPMATLASAVSGAVGDADLIVTAASTDLNGDHRLVAEAVRIAARPRPRPVSILEAEIPSTTFWNGEPFPANYYVDITDALETKIRALEEYRNEIKPFPHPWSREGLTLLARYHGMQAGYGAAEAFRLIRGYAGLLP
jgi:LmbE family N-acetylglucosaminyl deacetylase